jgi:hypothetical protein
MRTAVLVVAHLLVATTVLGQAPAPYTLQYGQQIARERGVLLLRNGQVLAGDIAKLDTHYSIVVNRGEVRVHQRDVESICRDLEEAYRQKRLQVREDCVQDHIDLAQWCHNNGLLAHAVEELKIAVALNPTHPLIPLIDRKIRMSSEQQAMLAQRAPAGRDANEPSVEELDRMVRGMPNGAVEYFTQVVQPMLTNNCTTSGCHGPAADGELRLLRIPSGRPPTRRLTQRNLYAAVRLINWDDPAKSPLLTAPIKPHGTTRAAIFTDKQVDQYQQLVRWVYLVSMGKKIEPEKPNSVVSAAHKEGAKPASAVVPARYEPADDQGANGFPLGGGVMPAVDEQPSDAMPQGNGPLSDSKAPPWADDLPAETAPPAENAPAGTSGLFQPSPTPEPAVGEPQAGGTAPRVQRGARQFTPLDPFDAQIFNRRFAPRPPAAPSESQ